MLAAFTAIRIVHRGGHSSLSYQEQLFLPFSRHIDMWPIRLMPTSQSLQVPQMHLDSFRLQTKRTLPSHFELKRRQRMRHSKQ